MTIKNPLFICVIIPLCGLVILGINTFASYFGEYHALAGSTLFLTLLGLTALLAHHWRRQTTRFIDELGSRQEDTANPVTELIRKKLRAIDQDHREAYDNVVRDLEMQKRAFRELEAELRQRLSDESDVARQERTAARFKQGLVTLLLTQVRRMQTQDPTIRVGACQQMEFLAGEILDQNREPENTFDTWQLLDDAAAWFSETTHIHVSVHPLCPQHFYTEFSQLRSSLLQFCLTVQTQQPSIRQFELKASPAPGKLIFELQPSSPPLIVPQALRHRQCESMQVSDTGLVIQASPQIARRPHPIFRQRVLVISANSSARQALADRLQALGATVTFNFHDREIHAAFVSSDGQDAYAAVQKELPGDLKVFVFGTSNLPVMSRHTRLQQPIDQTQLVSLLQDHDRSTRPVLADGDRHEGKSHDSGDNDQIPVFDPVAALKAANGSHEMAEEMNQLLLASLGNDRDLIARHIADGDFDEAAKTTHKLGGALSYCGFLRLKTATAELEQTLKANEAAQCHKKLMRFSSEAADVLNWIRGHPHPFIA